MNRKDVHTLVIGSGAAGLNTALQLYRKGITDVLILTEGLDKGTSINTGSDKQTYYKMSMCGAEGDSPQAMAKVYYDGGSTQGDLALVEAVTSSRAFYNLVDLGVPFPTDSFGQYVGYKTDHDPSRRATSIGPYTSREMCRALIKAVKDAGIPILENRDVIELITLKDGDSTRAAGAVVIGENDDLEVYKAENIIFAVGGPGGLYKTSVYPGCHTGAIGLALNEGALASNLTESQFGLASTGFRWNVSGTFMQVIPRFISTDEKGEEEREFLRDYFPSKGEMNSLIFLKGYQWPFDSAKVDNGSSIIDILVYIETVEKKRKVYLDFRSNPENFSFDNLSREALDYLEKSDALLSSPIKRLEKMNPGAIQLYLDHNIDIREEKLEIAVCAQHNNGGLAANIWWESENIQHLFPVGEVNGSHGVNRPGGSALNSGQVGGYRAAEYISEMYSGTTIDNDQFNRELIKRLSSIEQLMDQSKTSKMNWKEERKIFQERMSRSGAFIRKEEDLKTAINEARKQVIRMNEEASTMITGRGKREYFRNRHLCLSHLVYLEAILFALQSGIGSRGSALVLNNTGEKFHISLDEKWSKVQENRDFREKIQHTKIDRSGNIENIWIKRKEIPSDDLWFETAWKKYKDKEIYK